MIASHESGKLRPTEPASVPRNQVDGATTRSASTVSLIQSSTVCRKLRTMITTPIMIANPTIKADTVTPLRPGLRAACSTAISRMMPWAPAVLAARFLHILTFHPVTQTGARQESPARRQKDARYPGTGTPATGPMKLNSPAVSSNAAPIAPSSPTRTSRLAS